MDKKELIESLRNEYIQGLITEDYYKGKNWGINIALGLVNQLDEPEIKKERAWLNEKVYGLSETISNVDGIRRPIETWMLDKTNRPIETLIRMKEGCTIEPPKTLQVIVKNYDSTVYKTELPEDEVNKLIEGWKG